VLNGEGRTSFTSPTGRKSERVPKDFFDVASGHPTDRTGNAVNRYATETGS